MICNKSLRKKDFSSDYDKKSDLRPPKKIWRTISNGVMKFRFFLIFILLLGFTAIYAQEKKFVYDPKGKRDPFIPLVTEAGQLIELEPEEQGISGLHLEGIIFDKKELSYAIINSMVVKIGDWVGGYQVYKIEPKKVILLKEGEKFEIELKEE